MFDSLSPQPQDPLLALIGLYNSDTRADKVDLGVGVFRDETGHTPVMRAVKAAEKVILETQDSKSYVAPEGDRVFIDLLWTVVGGADCSKAVAGVQAPGGSGALRLAADLLAKAGKTRIWVGVPTWANHLGIFGSAGLSVQTYPYFDVPSQAVQFDRMTAALESAEAGDAVLLHASCHNPTGAQLTAAQWATVAEIVARKGLIPLIDSAYQGFGAGLEEDAAGLRTVIAAAAESLVAVSCSKFFGLYRERTGAVYAVGGSQNAVETARSNLVTIARTSYSMPPDHGSAVVRTILATPALKADWIAELNEMRGRLISLRQGLATAIGNHWAGSTAVAGQQGMFSLLPMKEADILALRKDHGIYMPTSGRINIAGLKQADIAHVAATFVPLLG